MRDLLCNILLKKCNDGNDTQIIITDDIADSVLLGIKSQQVRTELQDDLKTDLFYLNQGKILQKKVGNKIRQ